MRRILDPDLDPEVQMPRHVKDASIETRTARGRLPIRKKPFLRAIGGGLALAYRRLPNGPGTWSARRYLGGRGYHFEVLRTPDGLPVIADDFAEADGVKVMTFNEAVDAVRLWSQEVDAWHAADPGFTIRAVVGSYIEAQEKREGSLGVRSRMRRVLEDPLADSQLATVTADVLERWRERKLAGLVDGTAQRIICDFRAALNVAAKRHRDQLPATLRDAIRDGFSRKGGGPGVVAREHQVLPDADVRRIISAAWEIDAENGWNGDLARFVIALAATGARASQLVRMRVADVQAPQGRLMVPVSRKGRGTKNLSHIGVRVGDDVLSALAPATAGRRGHEVLFMRPYASSAPGAFSPCRAARRGAAAHAASGS
jgi:hypothetical protein